MRDNMEYAVIDIGSNSVRLLLPPKVNGLYHKELVMTRLGKDMEKGLLVPESIQRTVEAICLYVKEAKAHGFETLAFATSAVREAQNKQEFLDVVKNACGVDIDVISGQEEARLGFLGTGGEGMVDIGGGSTEIICKSENGLIVNSLKLGTVRTLGKFPEKLQTNSEAIIEFAEAAIIPVVSTYPKKQSFCAVGGTATALAALLMNLVPYDPCRVHGAILDQGELKQMIIQLCEMTPLQRRSIKALDPQRGDVIIPGAAIMLAFMKQLAPSLVTVSETDAMEGYLKAYIAQ